MLMWFIKYSNLQYVFIAFLFLIVISCAVKQLEFDKSSWDDRADMYYANRESMVEDLMNNYLEKGETYNNMIELIGEPNNIVKDYIVKYEITVNYGWDVDPVEGTDLVISFSEDSVITNFELKSWGRKFIN